MQKMIGKNRNCFHWAHRLSIKQYGILSYVLTSEAFEKCANIKTNENNIILDFYALKGQHVIQVEIEY